MDFIVIAILAKVSILRLVKEF
jgi:hypothetical protein